MKACSACLLPSLLCYLLPIGRTLAHCSLAFCQTWSLTPASALPLFLLRCHAAPLLPHWCLSDFPISPLCLCVCLCLCVWFYRDAVFTVSLNLLLVGGFSRFSISFCFLICEKAFVVSRYQHKLWTWLPHHCKITGVCMLESWLLHPFSPQFMSKTKPTRFLTDYMHISILTLAEWGESEHIQNRTIFISPLSVEQVRGREVEIRGKRREWEEEMVWGEVGDGRWRSQLFCGNGSKTGLLPSTSDGDCNPPICVLSTHSLIPL